MAHASTQTDSVDSLAKSKVERGTHSTRLHRNSKVASNGKVGQHKAGCPWLRDTETERKRGRTFSFRLLSYSTQMWTRAKGQESDGCAR